VLSGRGLFIRLITCPEEAIAHKGLLSLGWGEGGGQLNVQVTANFHMAWHHVSDPEYLRRIN